MLHVCNPGWWLEEWKSCCCLILFCSLFFKGEVAATAIEMNSMDIIYHNIYFPQFLWDEFGMPASGCEQHVWNQTCNFQIFELEKGSRDYNWGFDSDYVKSTAYWCFTNTLSKTNTNKLLLTTFLFISVYITKTYLIWG